MIRILTPILVLSLALAVSACNRNKPGIAFDGAFFDTKVTKSDDDRSVFTVVIEDVSQSVSGAMEAGRHAGTTYCIKNYGSSKIDWAPGPDDDPATLTIVENTMTFRGRCRV
ncbi:hypothetical protein [Shimia biformata]|uniref:hypothetical protein n=1 Tax=Shimia biformata TaxID=1294299 RepID=UPI00194F6703|nr:hypothetical protein [Shimia biformata]